MPLGESLGLKARVEPRVSKSDKRKVTKDLEDAINRAEETFGDGLDSGGFRDRTMPTPGGGRGGGGFGTGTAAGAGLARRGGGLLGSGVGGAAKFLGTVALGGVAVSRMLDAMTAASGRLQAVNSMFGQAMKLWFRPAGDMLGKTLRPMAEGLLKMALNFNEAYNKHGFAPADIEFDQTEIGQPGDVGGTTGPSGGAGFFEAMDNIERHFGDLVADIQRDFESGLDRLSRFRWSDYLDLLIWNTFVPSVNWGAFIGSLDWRDFVDSLNWGNFVDGLGLGNGRKDTLTEATGGFKDFVPGGQVGTRHEFLGDPKLRQDIASGDTLDNSGLDMDDAMFDVGGSETLAHGGIVTRPTVARLGEMGPEAVVPFDDYTFQSLFGDDGTATATGDPTRSASGSSTTATASEQSVTVSLADADTGGPSTDEIVRAIETLREAIEAQTDVIQREFDVTVESEFSVDRRTLAETVERTQAEFLPSTDTRTK